MHAQHVGIVEIRLDMTAAASSNHLCGFGEGVRDLHVASTFDDWNFGY